MLVCYDEQEGFIPAQERDMKFYHANTKLYDELIQERDQVWQQAFNEYTNNRCVSAPRQTKQELEDTIKSCAGALSSAQKIKAPELVIQYCQQRLENQLQKYNDGDYIVTKQEREYREFFEQQEKEFCGVYFISDAYKQFRNKVDRLIEETLGESKSTAS